MNEKLNEAVNQLPPLQIQTVEYDTIEKEKNQREVKLFTEELKKTDYKEKSTLLNRENTRRRASIISDLNIDGDSGFKLKVTALIWIVICVVIFIVFYKNIFNIE